MLVCQIVTAVDVPGGSFLRGVDCWGDVILDELLYQIESCWSGLMVMGVLMLYRRDGLDGGVLRDGFRVSRRLIGRLLVSFLLSVVSFFVFEALFSAFILYGGSRFEDWMVVLLVFFFRSGFAVMVSDLVMGVQSGRLWMGLLVGCLLYGIPSMILMDWLGLSGFITPRFAWSHYALLGFGLPLGMVMFLGLLLMSFVLDFPRLMLFVAVEGAIARFESK
jgi:hypothetical protein